MSAPLANQNRTRHGVRGYLALGSLPKGAAYIRRQIGELRTQLENTVAAADGEITLYKSALIQSTCRHEGRALLLSRFLRVEADLSLSDRLSILKEIGSATDSRDRCLKSLGLDVVKGNDPWAQLDRERRNGTLPLPATAAPTPPNTEAVALGHVASSIAGNCVGISAQPTGIN